MNTKMTIERISISEVLENPDNPRYIKDDKYKKLVKSIKSFPQMLDIRPIVIDETGTVLGGNMRLKACKEAGLKEIPIIRTTNLTEKQKKEFVLKDNQSFGEWDTSLLKSWDKELLLDSGFEAWDIIDIFGINEMDNNYKKSVEDANLNPDVTDVNDYIKQNIFFLNELMLEFIDDDIKESIRNIPSSDHDAITRDIKDIINKYGKNSIR